MNSERRGQGTPVSRVARVERIVEERNQNPSSSYHVTPNTQAMLDEFQELLERIRMDLQKVHHDIGIMKDIALEKGPKDLERGTLDKELAEGLYDYIGIALTSLR